MFQVDINFSGIIFLLQTMVHDSIKESSMLYTNETLLKLFQ